MTVKGNSRHAWHVIREGNPDCKHEDFVYISKTMDPPIPCVMCKTCGREIEDRSPSVARPRWPEGR
jgi:hypothetical protein